MTRICGFGHIALVHGKWVLIPGTKDVHFWAALFPFGIPEDNNFHLECNVAYSSWAKYSFECFPIGHLYTHFISSRNMLATEGNVFNNLLRRFQHKLAKMEHRQQQIRRYQPKCGCKRNSSTIQITHPSVHLSIRLWLSSHAALSVIIIMSVSGLFRNGYSIPIMCNGNEKKTNFNQTMGMPSHPLMPSYTVNVVVVRCPLPRWITLVRIGCVCSAKPIISALLLMWLKWIYVPPEPVDLLNFDTCVVFA